MTSFVVTGTDLHEAAAWASRLNPAKPTVPILAGVLLAAVDAELTLSAFDLETSGRVTLPAMVKEPGSVLVSGRLLAAVAKTVARDVDVVVEDRGGTVDIRCGRAEWQVPTMRVDDYPQLPTPADAVAAVDADVLRRAIARVLPAVSGELANLAGVRIEPSNDDARMTLVATDRWRLACADIPLLSGTAPTALVPADVLGAAARAAGSGPAELSANDTVFGLTTDTHAVIGRQIAEEFPRSWRSFIIGPGDRHATFQVDEMMRAVEQALVVADTGAAQLVLEFDDDEVRVFGEGGGRRAHAAAACTLVGPAMTVAVNPAYFREATSLHGSATVRIDFGANPNRPLQVSGDDPDYRHTLMPVRLPASRREA